MFDWLISDLPPELAACELECRVLNCRQDEFDRCEFHLRVANLMNTRKAEEAREPV